MMALSVATLSTPPLTTMPPELMLVPLRYKTPLSVLVSAPLPLKTPEMVAKLPLVTSIVPAPSMAKFLLVLKPLALICTVPPLKISLVPVPRLEAVPATTVPPANSMLAAPPLVLVKVKVPAPCLMNNPDPAKVPR